MRIYQVIDNLAFGDAVGNNAVLMKKALTRMGFSTEIYAARWDRRLPAGTVRPVAKLPYLRREDIVIYHFCNGSPLNRKLKTWPCRKILFYHNVTPPAFFSPYDSARASSLASALEDAAELAGVMDSCLVLSEFSKNDLLRMGYPEEKIHVMPGILIPFEDYAGEPDQDTLRRYSDGRTNILFVGRLSPNKKQEDIIRAFAYYKKHINQRSRLLLVGSAFSEDYQDTIKDYAKAIGAEDVELLGHISFASIIACYKAADIFACMSEHEGFCVPLAEAMFFDVPIIAYAAAAVPETLGGSGVLLDSKDPVLWANWIDRLTRDYEEREKILKRQREQMQKFTPSAVEGWFEAYLTDFLDVGCEAGVYGDRMRRERLAKVTLHFIEVRKSLLYLEGVVYSYSLYGASELHIRVNGDEVPWKVCERAADLRPVNGINGIPIGFVADIPLPDRSGCCIEFFIDDKEEPQDINYPLFCPVTPRLKHSVYRANGWELTCSAKHLEVSAAGTRKGEPLKLALEILGEGTPAAIFAFWLRLLCCIGRRLKKREIWLFSDRAMKANDNGECFFNYVHGLHDRKIKPFFILNKESGDYNRIRRKATVVPYLSFRHKLLFLLADYNISSNCLRTDFNPFEEYERYYRDLRQHGMFIYLDHGIKKDELSTKIPRYAIKADRLVCSSKREREMVLQECYGYREEQVILTGLCRYDYLYDHPERRIALMPTFRDYLFQSVDFRTGHFILKDGFEDSDYYKFYSSLITHPRLMEALKQYDYHMDFVMHPAFYPYGYYFPASDRVRIWGEEVVHRDIYAKASLLLTDFSSTTFDFAYLYKPQIYCQFDRETYYGESGHRPKGYFDFRDNGFGDVIDELEPLVDRIIGYISTGCVLEKKYEERINEFFAYHDRNNCERVYKEIIKCREQAV